MTTALNRPISRRSLDSVRDGARRRRLVVTLYPAGMIGIRPERTRREETLSLEAVFHTAVKARVAAEKAARKARRRAA